jgi:hypothetical protein
MTDQELNRAVQYVTASWLDEVYEEIAKRQPEALGLSSDDDDEGTETV